ncbi:hypothetical protein [Parabacteroides sp. PF5-6]|uniref:hypothetical protein n=1 Tax=Parabacteroides sp. PF5-6 TaxID=1742403 RepID=UPI002404F97A|nr:hypothetical protein [Parabacteroides sp. PF5-6]MDF9830721.1 hypothetical protein [Parabacteroides sp. PF5-6]
MTILELNAKKKAPNQYSPEELKERAILAIEQMERGEGTPHEEMTKKFTAKPLPRQE